MPSESPFARGVCAERVALFAGVASDAGRPEVLALVTELFARIDRDKDRNLTKTINNAINTHTPIINRHTLLQNTPSSTTTFQSTVQSSSN